MSTSVLKTMATTGQRGDKGGGRVMFGVAGVILAASFLFMRTPVHETPAPTPTAAVIDYDPCCAYPCENQGICMSKPDRNYTCDCTGTGHYGTNCEIPTWSTAIKSKLKPDPEWLHTFITSNGWVWAIINRLPFIHRRLMTYVYLSRGDLVDSPPTYESEHSYITLNAYYNESFYGRALPPVPEHCPTPMGVTGPKEYPDADELIKKVFLRREFIPEPHETNVLFQYYAQHFTHQFFRTDYKKGPHLTKGTGGVDVSNIYGLTEQDRRALRSGVDGKLRTQKINGEDFPPYLKDVPGISMDYPPHIPIPEEGKFALGHPFFALLPGLFAYATIWVREHNRVCDELVKVHPDWDDERIYQTARLIITGEVIKITIEDYVQHLSQYKLKLTFEPELTHGTRFQYHNRIHAEFNHLYHWHPLIPDTLNVSGTDYAIMDMAYSTAPVFKHGLDEFIHTMVNSRAGALTTRNHAHTLYPVLKKVIENGRELRFQSMNAYRRRFGMVAFTSFEDLTGETELAAILEELYGDIEAVEFYVGLLAERPGPSITPLTMVNAGGPWSVKGLLANPICSPRYWKPSTFGGEEGFNIIKTASLEKLFCLNMKGKCEGISFKVPQGTP
ncbi:prostaglandin G/H synthase 2-like [Penaeus chinensis]|uniref:prostaglandin G/H synthase 2-like n=1 Tax=Penaeus chinensis TaxID=139456 RepID=UPI001FB68817|nr:prostaglandin G/H synthase 2-like [Penaeus chinensis]